ncbi:S-layer homology domain-containing protein [Paenibacillus apiarius]|uniref:S-layer homology domain-containing protein n=1 Tax=Paenibacillus apiarius TaxID=46240 RepID=A0ABT4DWE5_9BACL|nr:S-layer homology domain-containing protein [Paenibacillus apiarius]MCY9514377.1 S-layer homology domain-containing protein [Paenibacillus apiarius]MCY9521085.1 S-layer homology domain-containing protein [Paenibacillus apiarius]MCY9551932.1 S-layer homology domain-containing protein [Paenibacillus apiarius]MCY9557819.1 S-layer homology domain-containing protein [Paenibacillus apiarius]MCY9684506.1 S-layer homology domain-containing protein [Paenibacillus apiarius]
MKLHVKAMLVISVFISLLWSGAADASAAPHRVQEKTVNRTKQEIINKWLQYKPMDTSFQYMKAADIYEAEPQTRAPYAPGKLKAEYVTDGVNATNFVRYLAGLPDDIEPEWGLHTQQQAAALLNAVNDRLTHHPTHTSGMEDVLFKLGSEGTRTSNLSMGRSTFYSSIIHGYMSDSGPGNIDRIGHRRWILNPPMQKTMFGIVFSAEGVPYSSMYAVNKDRAEEVKYDYISWPSQGLFPEEMFAPDDPWSFSLNVERYDRTRTDRIQVTLTRTRDGKQWVFDNKDTNKHGKYFNVETGPYGVPFTIIFRPDGIERFHEDDVFHVEVSGVYDKAGQAVDIEYDTVFFDMIPEVTLRASSLRLAQGEKIKLNTRTTSTHLQAADVQFEMADPEVALVDAEGYITGLKPGQTLLGVKNYFQSYDTILIDVEQPGSGDRVSPWALPDYRRAKSNGIVPYQYDQSYQAPITRIGFTELAVRLCENILGESLAEGQSPFKDISSIEISKAYANGLIGGTSNDMFSPFDNITRQQAAALLLHLHTTLTERTGSGASVLDTAKETFADDANIAPWAKDYVYKAVSLSLLTGVGEQKFDPDGLLTYEQTFVLLQKLFDMFVEQ